MIKVTSLFLLALAAVIAWIWMSSGGGSEAKITFILLAISIFGYLGEMRFRMFRRAANLTRGSLVKMPWYMEESDRIACLCYRIDSSELKFLLIRDFRGSKWGLPKGIISKLDGVDENLRKSLSQEAGIFDFEIIKGRFGRFSHYSVDDQVIRTVALSIARFDKINPPLEAAIGINREPTMFTLDELKEMLRDGRKLEFYSDMVKLIVKARDFIVTHERNNGK